jgi:hypothetical protein
MAVKNAIADKIPVVAVDTAIYDAPVASFVATNPRGRLLLERRGADGWRAAWRSSRLGRQAGHPVNEARSG